MECGSRRGHHGKLGGFRLVCFSFSGIKGINHVVTGVIKPINRNTQEKHSDTTNEIPIGFFHEKKLYVNSKPYSVVCLVMNFKVF